VDPFLRHQPTRQPLAIKPLLWGIFAIVLLVGAGYLLARYQDRQELKQVERSSLDTLVVALRENRNRLEVQRLSGTVTTNREVRGGPAGLLRGELTVRQPWSVAYFTDMADLGLDDYAWDERSRTLTVRAPAVRPDPPNIDESRQVVAQDGFIITRSMQNQLREGVARGARQQAVAEANTPENLAAATAAAREAIARNLQGPLRAAGLSDVRIVVRTPTDGGGDGERWNVSRSIEEVLRERQEGR
jgi:cytochrome c-type biogenesis protein CcmH/NrfF